MTVIPFPSPDPSYWVCHCGCASFFLRDDGEAVCTSCDRAAGADGQGWIGKIKDAGPRDPAMPPVEWTNVSSLAKSITAKRATDDDVAVIVVVKDTGALHVFSTCMVPDKPNSTAEQVAWAAERLEQAKGMLT